jgi:hypothetical protein
MHPIWFLQWLFQAGFWGVASNVATALGIAFALIGAYLANASYKKSSKIADDQHMHGIFKDYLRLRYDFEVYRLGLGLKPGAYQLKPLLYDVVASRLYAAEEMWLWVRRLEEGNRRRRKAEADRTIEIESWLATVVSHVVGEEPPEVTAYVLINYIRCYSLDFLEFVEKYLESDELTSVVIEQRQAVKDRLPRPAGRAETSLTIQATGPGVRRSGEDDVWPPRHGRVVAGHRAQGPSAAWPPVGEGADNRPPPRS